MSYVYLFAAILAEVVGAIATRFSDGFTKPLPSIITAVGVLGAYYFLSLALKHGMEIGVAYGIWAAVGVTFVALIGAMFLGDTLTWVQVAGIALLIVGVLALEMGGASH